MGTFAQFIIRLARRLGSSPVGVYATIDIAPNRNGSVAVFEYSVFITLWLVGWMDLSIYQLRPRLDYDEEVHRLRSLGEWSDMIG